MPFGSEPVRLVRPQVATRLAQPLSPMPFGSEPVRLKITVMNYHHATIVVTNAFRQRAGSALGAFR